MENNNYYNCVSYKIIAYVICGFIITFYIQNDTFDERYTVRSFT